MLPVEATRAIGVVVPRTPIRSIRLFDPAAFLSQAGLGRKIVNQKKGLTVFSQGDTAETVFISSVARSS